MKFTFTPKAVEGLVGATAIDTNSAAVTVRVLEAVLSLLLIPLRLAEMTVLPVATGVARPSLPEALLAVAVANVAEFQVTAVVIS